MQLWCYMASDHPLTEVCFLCCSNPTNIIIGEATGLSFLSFSKWSLLPTFGEVFAMQHRGCCFVALRSEPAASLPLGHVPSRIDMHNDLPIIAVSGVSVYFIILLYFRRKIQDAPQLEDDVDPSTLLRDKYGTS